MVGEFDEFLGVQGGEQWREVASAVLALNIVHGDALSMRTRGEPQEPITFAEWSYPGKGRFHRRDFRFDTLTQMSSFSEEDTLFADLGKHEIFTPTVDHGPLRWLISLAVNSTASNPAQPRKELHHRPTRQ